MKTGLCDSPAVLTRSYSHPIHLFLCIPLLHPTLPIFLPSLDISLAVGGRRRAPLLSPHRHSVKQQGPASYLVVICGARSKRQIFCHFPPLHRDHRRRDFLLHSRPRHRWISLFLPRLPPSPSSRGRSASSSTSFWSSVRGPAVSELYLRLARWSRIKSRKIAISTNRTVTHSATSPQNDATTYTKSPDDERTIGQENKNELSPVTFFPNLR